MLVKACSISNTSVRFQDNLRYVIIQYIAILYGIAVYTFRHISWHRQHDQQNSQK
jgi:hypothetical protein